MQQERILVLLSFLTIFIGSILFLRPVASQAPNGPQLHLHRGTFDAAVANRAAQSTALVVAGPLSGSAPTTLIEALYLPLIFR